MLSAAGPPLHFSALKQSMVLASPESSPFIHDIVQGRELHHLPSEQAASLPGPWTLTMWRLGAHNQGQAQQLFRSMLSQPLLNQRPALGPPKATSSESLDPTDAPGSR